MTGGVNFEHVFAFQIKCMMAGQYHKLVNAKKPDDIIIACLRLGWVDAFRQTSRNTEKFNCKKDAEKSPIIDAVCGATTMVNGFKEYASKTSTEERVKCINALLGNTEFTDNIAQVKDISNAKFPLCLGHIQKMYNMAIKLLLCLLLTAEYVNKQPWDVPLSQAISLKSKSFLDFKEQNFKDICFDTADCPIDSIILGKLNPNANTSVWSKFGADEDHPYTDYENTQTTIANIQKGTGKSNLCFDFENWNV